VFTGIVEEKGSITSRERHRDSESLVVHGPRVIEGTALGDSISVNGVCLTVTSVDVTAGTFSCDVMAETLARSSLAGLDIDTEVNLERAMAADGRFGGHFVQGHVDETAELLSRTPGERWDVLRFSLPAAVARYVVAKGSITVDGVSLTVSQRGPDCFEVSLIPATLRETTLGSLQPGDSVNIEVDVIAKYVESMMQAGAAGGPPAEGQHSSVPKEGHR
jgi:riboflavin synthase